MIETPRLILRDWGDADRDPWAKMCADPRVMATIGPLQSRAEADAAVDRYQGYARDYGFTMWALQRSTDSAFLGLCGLKPGAPGTPVEAEIEIGWRLAADHWGEGYAREAAQASLGWAWKHLGCVRVGAITGVGNVRSRGLMDRLGMTRDLSRDFCHPAFPSDDPLGPHVTYWMERPA